MHNSKIYVFFLLLSSYIGIVTTCRELTSQFLLKHAAISSLLLYMFSKISV
jgi:hypothetical protein